MILQKLENIVNALCNLKEDSEKCEKGNASAGRRVRKEIMNQIKQLKELRAEILEMGKK